MSSAFMCKRGVAERCGGRWAKSKGEFSPVHRLQPNRFSRFAGHVCSRIDFAGPRSSDFDTECGIISVPTMDAAVPHHSRD
jgi:hypothetical protein